MLRIYCSMWCVIIKRKLMGSCKLERMQIKRTPILMCWRDMRTRVRFLWNKAHQHAWKKASQCANLTESQVPRDAAFSLSIKKGEVADALLSNCTLLLLSHKWQRLRRVSLIPLELCLIANGSSAAVPLVVADARHHFCVFAHRRHFRLNQQVHPQERLVWSPFFFFFFIICEIEALHIRAKNTIKADFCCCCCCCWWNVLMADAVCNTYCGEPNPKHDSVSVKKPQTSVEFFFFLPQEFWGNIQARSPVPS